MKSRTIMTGMAALGAAAAFLPAGAGAASQSGASLVIRHQVAHCHAWSLNGGAYKAAQTLSLKRGGTVTITNYDMMPHQLFKLSGPAISERLVNAGNPSAGKLKAPYARGMMPHMSSVLRVTFPAKGVYTLRTKTGDDYMSVKTTGADNVLRLVVHVS